MRHVPFGQLIWFVRPLTLFLTWFQCSIPFLRSKTKSQEILHFTRNSMNISPFFLSDWLPLFHNRTENFFYWKKNRFPCSILRCVAITGFFNPVFWFFIFGFLVQPSRNGDGGSCRVRRLSTDLERDEIRSEPPFFFVFFFFFLFQFFSSFLSTLQKWTARSASVETFRAGTHVQLVPVRGKPHHFFLRR